MRKIMRFLFVFSILAVTLTLTCSYLLNGSIIDTSAKEPEVILSIPYSSKIIGYAPESFFITDDNQLYILDSDNDRILNFYDGNVVETINVEADERMMDMVITDQYIYILLNKNIILKVDHNGSILDKMNVSPAGYEQTLVSAEPVIHAESISYEENCLKVFFTGGKEYNLTDPKADVEVKNIGAGEHGFNAISSCGKRIEFPSFSTPAAAYRITSINDYEIYYTSEIYHGLGSTMMNRRLYFITSGRIVKYVQLEQTQFTKPNRLYRILKDGTVVQMITTNDGLNIVRLGFLTDYSQSPSFMNAINEATSPEPDFPAEIAELTKKNEELTHENNSLKERVKYLEESPEKADISPLMSNYKIDELLQKIYTEDCKVDIFPGHMQSTRLESIGDRAYFVFYIDRMAVNPDWDGPGSVPGGYFINTEKKYEEYKGEFSAIFLNKGYSSFQEKQEDIIANYNNDSVYNFYMIGDEIVYVGPDPGP